MNPSGPGATGSRRSQATVERLHEATTSLIAEVGWDNTSSRRVADRAGVSLGVVHYHFDSIEELRRRAAIELIERFFGDATAFAVAPGENGENSGDTATDAGPPTAAAAIHRLLTVLAAGDPYRVELNVLYQSLVAASRDELLRSELARHLAEYRSFAEGWLASIGVPDAKQAAGVIVAAVDGFLLQRSLDPDLDPSLFADGLARLATPQQRPDALG